MALIILCKKCKSELAKVQVPPMSKYEEGCCNTPEKCLINWSNNFVRLTHNRGHCNQCDCDYVITFNHENGTPNFTVTEC